METSQLWLQDAVHNGKITLNKKKGASMTQDASESARKAGRRTEIIVTSGAQCLRLGMSRKRFAQERAPT